MAELRKRRLLGSLYDWCEYCLEPIGQKPQAHHRLLIDKLEAVERGEIKRLMVSMPPGSAKTTYSSVLFPPWLLARQAGRTAILASHTADLAEANSGKVIRTIGEFGGAIGLETLSQGVKYWRTNKRNEVKSAGVGGPITGRRADCLTGDSVIITNLGEMRLDAVDLTAQSVYVLSYVEKKESCSFQRIRGIARRNTREVWRVRTASGNVVEATGNHRFYTTGGWRECSALHNGDVLLSTVRHSRVPQSVRCSEVVETQCGNGLQPQMRRKISFELSRCFRAGLSNLRRFDENLFAISVPVFAGMPKRIIPTRRNGKNYEQMLELRSAYTTAPHLFGAVPKGTKRQKSPIQQDAATRTETLRWVREAICSQVQGWNWPLLQSLLRFKRAFNRDDRHGKSLFSPREGKSVRKAESLVRGQAGHLAARQDVVRPVRIDGIDRGAPHQHDANGSPIGEFGLPLPGVPSESALAGAFRAERDVIVSIERIRRECDVYDIQVEGTECFFANGVLVHNCAIIDDPVKSREDAESETYRNKAWDWYWSDLYTRLKPGAGIVLIMTRWHEDDLAGRLLQSGGDEWHTVTLPAEAGDNDPLGRAPGEFLWSGDPGYDYGTLLRDTKRTLEQNGAMRDWWSLYQQSPRPLEGALFKTALLQALPVPLVGKTVRAWDLAATAALGTRDPDWTVGARMTRTAEGRFVIDDVVRLRGAPDEVEAAIVATASRDGHGVQIRLPQDPGQAGKAQALYLTRKLAGYRVHSQPVTGDKSTRAAPLAAQVNVGNVSIVQAPWNRPLIDELAGFPSATHDDQVDSLSDAFAGLIAPPEPAKTVRLNLMAR